MIPSGGWRVVAACAFAAATALSATAADAATNLIANPGFELQGGSATVFSDTLPDLSAWTMASGGFTDTAGSMVATGAARTSDVAIVTGSTDYRDGTFQAEGVPIAVNPHLEGGLVFRYRDAADFYGCVATHNALQLMARVGGADTVLASTRMTSQVGQPGWLRVTMAGSSLTCAAYAGNSGAPGNQIASVTATSTTYTSGAIGVFDTNTGPAAGRMLTFSAPTMAAVVPASWTAPVVAAGRPGEVPDTVLPPTGGSESMQIFGGAASFDGYSQQTGIPVFGSTAYTFQAEIRTQAVAGSAQVVAVESPSGTQTVLGSVSGTTAWTLYTTTFTTQPGTTSIAIRTRLHGSGTANFDDLSLTTAPTVALEISAAAVNLGAVNPLSSPFSYPRAVTATVTATAGWTLATDGAGDFADGAGKTIPLGVLAWRQSGIGGYTPFTTTPATVATSAAATPVGGTAVPLDYQLTITFPDPPSPAAFSTTITYIATTP